MSELAYLDQGLWAGGRLRDDLGESVRAVAYAWLAQGVDPARVDLMAEHLARWAALLANARAGTDAMVAGVAHLAPPPAVCDLLARAAPAPLDAKGMAALAVHLVDIAEAMALAVFVPELPAMSARADRSGEAARSVGAARHLKG